MNSTNKRAILLLRQDKPAVGKKRGDIVSIIPENQQLGKQVDKSNAAFSVIYVTDLPLELESELVNGTKVFRVPESDDPMISALQSKDDHIGHVTVNTATLLNYIVDANA